MSLMNNFSPNMLKTFSECEYKFFLKYIKKISIPQPSVFFEKGKKIHALASYYLRGEDILKMEKTLNEEEKKVWATLKSNKYFNLEPVHTEYNLTCKVGTFWIGGRLDALVKNAGDYFILDYKTGNIPANAIDDFQTITYLLCADKLLAKSDGYGFLKFVYIGLKQGEEQEIELTQQLKKDYEAKIISNCEKIIFATNSKVFNKCKTRCKYCEYKSICQREE